MHLCRIPEFLQWQSCGNRVAIEWLPSGYRVATEWHACILATTLHASRASATKSQEQGIVLWAGHGPIRSDDNKWLYFLNRYGRGDVLFSHCVPSWRWSLKRHGSQITFCSSSWFKLPVCSGLALGLGQWLHTARSASAFRPSVALLVNR